MPNLPATPLESMTKPQQKNLGDYENSIKEELEAGKIPRGQQNNKMTPLSFHGARLHNV